MMQLLLTEVFTPPLTHNYT